MLFIPIIIKKARGARGDIPGNSLGQGFTRVLALFNPCFFGVLTEFRHLSDGDAMQPAAAGVRPCRRRPSEHQHAIDIRHVSRYLGVWPIGQSGDRGYSLDSAGRQRRLPLLQYLLCAGGLVRGGRRESPKPTPTSGPPTAETPLSAADEPSRSGVP